MTKTTSVSVDCISEKTNFINGSVYYIEGLRIAKRRESADIPPNDAKARTALCLSGGGIRSAVFGLGFIQALQKHDRLRFVDYLSTVSGGSYIGACYTWCRAMGIKYPFGSSRKDHKTVAGGDIVNHLRTHSNYLAPGGGIDYWSFAAAILGGSAVSLAVILPLILLFVYFMSSIHIQTDAFSISNRLQENLGGTDGFRIMFALGLTVLAFFVLRIFVFALLTGFRTIREAFWNERFRNANGIILFVGVCLLAGGSLSICYDFISTLTKTHKEWTMIALTVPGAVGLVFAIWSGHKKVKQKNRNTTLLNVGFYLTLYSMFLWAYHFTAVNTDILLPFLLGALVFSLILAAVADINHVSMHRYYRNRIMDAYMPGFFKNKDRKKISPDSFYLSDIETNSDAPYHIINATIQTVDSNNPVLKERSGESFIFSPEYCGSEHTQWIKTKDYLNNSMNLATATAISSAAVDTNTSITRSRPLSFIMSLFNLRLGYWTFNPKNYNSRFKIFLNRIITINISWYSSLFADLLGFGLNEKRKIIHLTDGGHYDMLGLYEMIRRRCAHIVVVDAGNDSARTYHDLARVIAMVRADFGVEIKGLDLSKLEPDPVTGISEKPFAVCEIDYDHEEKGILYYIKPSIINGLPPDVISYFKAHPSFPQQSIADQFFDEIQYEAYRELGYCTGDLFCKDNFNFMQKN